MFCRVAQSFVSDCLLGSRGSTQGRIFIMVSRVHLYGCSDMLESAYCFPVLGNRRDMYPAPFEPRAVKQAH